MRQYPLLYWRTESSQCIRGEDGKPKAFNSAIEAYQACLEAVGYFDQIADERMITDDHNIL